MKECSFCGLQNSDEATRCETCQAELATPESSPIPSRPKAVTPLAEQRFWERMTFRQFAALLMRLQAIWLLWYAALDLTYLPPYFGIFYTGGFYISPGSRLSFFLLVLRILLHVAAAVAVIQYADRLVSWLVRDWIRSQPPEPAADTPAVSNEPLKPKPGSESGAAPSDSGPAR